MIMSVSKSKQTLSNRYSSGAIGSNGEKPAGKKAPIIAIAAVMSVIAIAVVLVAVISGGDGTESAPAGYNLIVTPDNIEEQLADESISKAAAGTYDVCMNSVWTFNNASAVSYDAYVENVISNSNTVNFTLTRNDTGEVIYTSPYIPVGSRLRNIKLSDDSLTAGTYNCTVQYHLVDENYQELSALNIAVSVIIDN